MGIWGIELVKGSGDGASRRSGGGGGGGGDLRRKRGREWWQPLEWKKKDNTVVDMKKLS